MLKSDYSAQGMDLGVSVVRQMKSIITITSAVFKPYTFLALNFPSN